ncbi:MAG: phosphatase PAP2 family protein [Mesorhizobium sp.]|uniref:phosphatase PAP2 family protein n=1 Tax=Mesorhizobium sp. TaxID=1871066 RepID=UPI001ACEB2D1|nr:phosphatase PAP2 family protein [Mesorhizobium sp.]MBN9218357.1 phosphatase PAP2 family protein [Mesorhizobium sp.]
MLKPNSPSNPSLLTRLGGNEIWPVAAVLVAGCLVLTFGLLAEEVLEGDTSRFDMTVLMALRSGGNPANPIGPAWLGEMGRDVTSLGSFAFLGFIFAATVGYLLLIRKRGQAVLMTVAVLGGVGISTLLKIGFDRPRPDIQHAVRVFTASFPSGHATLSTITFLTLGALLTRANTDRRIKFYFVTLAVFLTIMVGLSRVYLGVHYPTDVLAGWCVGAAWAILCWTGASWLQQRGALEPPEVSVGPQNGKKG